MKLPIILLILFSGGAAAFSVEPGIRPTALTVPRTSSTPLLTLFAKKNSRKAKGFGAPTSSSSATTTEAEDPKKKSASSATPVVPQPKAASVSPESTPAMNAGQRALAEMRRQKAEEKDAELRRVREMLSADQQMKEAPASIPEPVAQRMGKRMLPFVGLPFILGMGTFVGFWYMATYKNLVFEASTVAGATIGILVFGLLGITYSVMSASWDPDREGSFLGTDEFAKNLENIKEGLGRSRENAVLRDNIAGLGEDELKSAMADLERREAAEAKKQQSLEKKLKEELD